jgi:hypothetical protein
MIQPKIIAGDLFIRRIAAGKTSTHTPAEAERLLDEAADAKLMERAAAKHALHEARSAYKAALMSEAGCYAQRAALIDAERVLARLDADLAALDKERAEVSRIVAEHRAADLQRQAAADLANAIAPYANLERYAA